MCSYSVALLLTKTINLKDILKAKNFSKIIVNALLIIQIFIFIGISILFSTTTLKIIKIDQIKEEVSKLSFLEDYYGFSGANSNYYDSLDENQLAKVDENIQKMYEEEDAYYFAPSYSMYLNINASEENFPKYKYDHIYMNQKYIDDFVEQKEFANLLPEIINLLMPEIYKTNENKIIESLILKDPEIILADEPTGSLDKENGNLVLKILKDFKKQNKTVIVVTQDTSILEHFDRIIQIR